MDNLDPHGGSAGRAMEPFNWTEELTMNLLEACRVFQLRNGSHEAYIWSEVTQEFARTSGITIDGVCAKNKLVNLRKQWRLWKAFWHNELEMACTPITGHLLGTERMWSRKIKENPHYAKYKRDGGVPAKMSNMWDAVFGDQSNDHDEGLLRRALPRTNYVSSCSQFPPMSMPAPHLVTTLSDDEDELLGLSIGRSSSPSCGSKGKGKMKHLHSIASPGSVKKPRTVDSLYDNHLFILKQTSGRLFSGVRTSTELGTSSAGTGPVTSGRIKSCIDLLDEMVEQEVIAVDDPLWAFTVCELRKFDVQTMFLDLETHAKRLAWLKFYFDNFENLKKLDE